MPACNKNRDRQQFTFANINLLGKCNANCFFCLGKELEDHFSQFNQLSEHFFNWKGFDKLIERCKELGIPQIYITGQNTDSLQYVYLWDLIQYLKGQGFFVGLRTNGLWAHFSMPEINSCTTCFGDAVSYSIHTRDSDTQKKMIGVAKVPDWDLILRSTTSKMRVSVVVCDHNVSEVPALIEWLSSYPNIEYIQLRRICSEERDNVLGTSINAYDQLKVEMLAKHNIVKEFASSKIIHPFGKDVVFWETVNSSINSINYFTDGTLSEEYFIVEGYKKIHCL